MHFTKSSIVSFALLASSQLVAGHSAITGATGDQGGAGSAIGIDPNTPRDGTRRNPFQQDATRFKGDAAATCGETLGGGTNDIQAGTAMVMQLNGPTLPQVSAGGSINMTLHQVNGDGAGPYTCMIDATGTGTQWTQMQVTTNVAGNAQGRNNDNQKMDLPLAAAIPAGQTCTGTVAGQSNVCMVRCQNPARAGPFGGCVPVQMAGAATATGTTPAAGVAPPAGAVPSGTAATGATGQQAGALPAQGQAGAGTTTGAGALPAQGQAGAGTTTGTGALPAQGQAGAGTGALPAQGQAGAGTTQAGTGALPAQGQAGTSTAGQQAGAAGVGATGQTAGVGATGQSTGATAQSAGVGATGQTGLTQRSAKKSSDGAIVTDDDQEEEVDLIGEEDEEFKRWVVKNN